MIWWMIALMMTGAAAQDAPAPLKQARPISPADWVRDNDYPAEALKNHESGTVIFRLDVGTDGKVARCNVMTSSGSDLLDRHTCAIMIARGRFHPAEDSNGSPVAGTWNSKFSWEAPH
jgi:protein TonB